MLDGIPQYPVINHVYGSDAMVHHGRDFGADVVITLQDTWVLNPTDLQQVNRWIPWVPVDHDPVPPGVLQNLRLAYRLIAMSRHGQRELARNGLNAEYIPHSVNTEIFKPMDKSERKKQSGLPEDCFLIGMVAANKEDPPRKGFQHIIDAFAEFLKVEPKALLYIHSNPEFPGGFNFRNYANFIGVGDRVLTPDSYQMTFKTPKEKMSLIYNTFDMLVAPSISEGFCIPIIEAQACGVPVVCSNFTSMPELIKKGLTGELVELEGKRYSPQGSFMGIPSTQGLYDAIMKVYKGNRPQMRAEARKWIEGNFSTDKIFKEKWLPFLEKVEIEVHGKAIDTPEKTAHNK